MIEKCIIEKINDEEIMFVYLNFDYEFSRNFNSKSVKSEINKTIKQQGFKGKKVLFVVSGIIIGSLLLNNKPLSNSYDYDYINSTIINKNAIVETIDDSDINISNSAESNTIDYENKTEISENIDENINSNVSDTKNINNNINSNISDASNIQNKNENIIQNNDIYNTSQNNDISNDDYNEVTDNSNQTEESVIETETSEQLVTVYRTSGEVISLSMTDYLVGVVAAEMPASFPVEALKAQAVVARTYTLRALGSGRRLTDSTSTQVYKDNSQLRNLWGSEYDKYYSKIYNAVTSTENIAIYYNGNYIDAVYHSTSNGYTENAENVWGNSIPYLQSVSSYWDQNASSYYKTITKEEATIINLLGIENLDTIEILERNSSGRVEQVQIGSKIFSGVELRSILGLRSTDFEITKDNEVITITTKGYGHGVGMSQYGAKGMAEEGYNYIDILKHYYTNVDIY